MLPNDQATVVKKPGYQARKKATPNASTSPFPPHTKEKNHGKLHHTTLVISTGSLRSAHPRSPLPLEPLPVTPTTPTRRRRRLPLCRRHRALATSLAPQSAGLKPPCLLVRAIEFRLDGAADLERRHGRPHAALAPQNPVLESFLRGRLEQADKIAGRHLGHERHARTRHALVDEEAADAGGEQAQSVELAKPVADLETHHAHEKSGGRHGPIAGLEEGRAVHVAL